MKKEMIKYLRKRKSRKKKFKDKESIQINKKKTDNPIKKKAKILNKHFTKRIYLSQKEFI